jgi:hypothetical protein
MRPSHFIIHIFDKTLLKKSLAIPWRYSDTHIPDKARSTDSDIKCINMQPSNPVVRFRKTYRHTQLISLSLHNVVLAAYFINFIFTPTTAQATLTYVEL